MHLLKILLNNLIFLKTNPASYFFGNALTSGLLVLAILVGSVIGTISPGTGESLGSWVDPAILTLIGILFFEVRFETLKHLRGHLRFLTLAWVANFVIIPTLGYGLAAIVMGGQPPFFLGLFIYFMAPCTDWFLGFTRLAKGNVALGAVLLPINLITQLLLYPVYLGIFAQKSAESGIGEIGSTLLQWFLIPLLCGVAVHLMLGGLLKPVSFEAVLGLSGRVVPFILAVIVLGIFAANISTILEHVGTFALILVAVFVFFAATYFLVEGLSALFHLEYPERVLLTMTTAARNAPLMLGITAVAFPDQPLVYAAIIIGMLVEFPHLTILKHILLHRRKVPNAISSLEIAR